MMRDIEIEVLAMLRKITKAALAACLIAVIGVGLTACGKSPAVKNCETLIKAIGDDATIEDLEYIAAAGTFYDMLSEEDAKKVNTSALDAAEKKLLDITGSPFQVCKQLMDYMKDPSSFRIYGDVRFVDMSNTADTCETAYVTIIDCDAKNGFGAYDGKSIYEAVALDGKVYFVTEDDEDYYIDPISLLSPPEFLESKISSYTFSGKRIAELIGCEYMD